MLVIESIAHAPSWMAEAAREAVPAARAVACLRMYPNVDATAYPDLRDRTDELRAMLRGLVGDLDAPVTEVIATGSDLIRHGFEPVGAARTHQFKLMSA